MYIIKKNMCIYMCVWSCLNKYINITTCFSKQKFLTPSWLVNSVLERKKHRVDWVTHRYLHVSDQVLSDLLSERRVRLPTAFCVPRSYRSFWWKGPSIGTRVMHLRLKFYELGVPCIIIPRALHMFIPSHTG